MTRTKAETKRGGRTGSRARRTDPARSARKSSLRAQTITGLGDPIRIEPHATPPVHGDALGYFDEATGTIKIRADQPEAGKHVILLHELLHLVDATMVQAGVTKRRVSHDWICGAAPNLLAVLVCGGFWRGLTKADLLPFLAGHCPEPETRKEMLREAARAGSGRRGT